MRTGGAHRVIYVEVIVEPPPTVLLVVGEQISEGSGMDRREGERWKTLAVTCCPERFLKDGPVAEGFQFGYRSKRESMYKNGFSSRIRPRCLYV